MRSLFPEHEVQSRPRKDLSKNNASQSALVQKIYELLQGKRVMLKAYSNALQSEVLFVNSEQVNMEQLPEGLPVYTTRELAQIISFSREEFQRFHYLKTRMVG
ncbi:MAG: hypothetical protein WAN36_09825 [Calditrichia bacterium]